MTEEVWDGAERRKAPQHCQQDILDKLTEIEVELRLMRPFIQRVTVTLYGNGREGMAMEQDRLKQKVGLFTWALGIVYIAVVGLALKRWLG